MSASTSPRRTKGLTLAVQIARRNLERARARRDARAVAVAARRYAQALAAGQAVRA